MELVVRKADLLRELQLFQGIVERKNTIPILANVLIEAEGNRVRFLATDLEVGLRSRCRGSAVENLRFRRSCLSERLHEGVDKRVEISVALTEILDLPDRMDDGRVMLAAKASSDFRERRIRERLAQIHCYLPRHRD